MVDSIVPDDEDGSERQPQQHIVFDQPRPTRLIVDLTVGQEQCCLCSNVLGEGGDAESRIFVFDNCGCVCG
jgi:hypothetical protein